VLLTKLLPYILFEKYIYILALEMANPGKQHYANCIGTLSFRWVTQKHSASSPINWTGEGITMKINL